MEDNGRPCLDGACSGQGSRAVVRRDLNDPVNDRWVKKMRIARALVLLSLFPGVSGAQVPPNSASFEAYGLVIIAGIDKFEYGPTEPLQMSMLIVNPTSSPISVPNAVWFCPMAI